MKILHKTLTLKAGDEFLLRVEKIGFIPLNTPLVSIDKPSVALLLKVKSIASGNCYGRFSLNSNQSAPFNVFISRGFLADKLGLMGRANLILITAIQNPALLNKTLSKHIKLTDIGLKIREVPGNGNFELISDRIFIDKQISKVIDSLSIEHQNIETYFVNAIHRNAKETPYSFVSAISFPLLPVNLKSNEIIINEWLATDMCVKPGDTVSLDYFVIGPLHTIKEKSNLFIIKLIIDNHSKIEDRTLMPSIPGFSEAISCRDWNPGVPVNLKKIRKKDEKYWNDYRGTPKAFISTAAGLKLWDNSFGNYTAVRFDKKYFSSPDSISNLLLRNIKLKDIGMNIIPVHKEGISAAANSIDFGELFLYLSFFIIVASILLIALTYSLNTEARSQETGILSGLGFTQKHIVLLRFAESVFIILSGGLAGAFIGILYNDLLIYGLNSVWTDAVREPILQVYILPVKLVVGSIIGIFVALVTVYFVTIQKLKQPVTNLVKGFSDINFQPSKLKFSLTIAIIGITGSVCLVGISIITGSYNNAGMFLTAGGLFLLGSANLIMYYISRPPKNKNTLFGIFNLAIKNAGRNKRRSFATILILALGTFIIILTGSYRKTYFGEENQRKSGTGGFLFWAGTTMPVPYNLNEPEGKNNLITEKESDLDSVRFIQLHSVDGDDASCLNLNQVYIRLFWVSIRFILILTVLFRLLNYLITDTKTIPGK